LVRVTVHDVADPAPNEVGLQVKELSDCPKASAPMDDRNKAVTDKANILSVFNGLISLKWTALGSDVDVVNIN